MHIGQRVGRNMGMALVLGCRVQWKKVKIGRAGEVAGLRSGSYTKEAVLYLLGQKLSMNP